MQRMNATSILTTSLVSAQCPGGIGHIITKIGSDMMTVFGLSKPIFGLSTERHINR